MYPSYVKTDFTKCFGQKFQPEKLSPIGGMTNTNYLIHVDSRDYVLRIIGDGPAQLIDRKNEWSYQELATSLGLSIDITYFNPKTGTKIAPYLQNAKHLTAQLAAQPSVIDKFTSLIRQLHTAQCPSNGRFDPFILLEEYEQGTRDVGEPLYTDYPHLKAKVISLQKEVEAGGLPLVPCHNDPCCENLLLDKASGTLSLIDWEYAGLNYHTWDLADLAMEANFSDATISYLATSYYEHKPTRNELRQIYIQAVYVDFLWSIWAVWRLPSDPVGLRIYADTRMDRARRNIALLENTL